MVKLTTPVDVKLSDDELGREPTRLCITFSPVPDATTYVAWVDSTEWSMPVQPGSWIGPLKENTAYVLQVQARASGFDDSDLSAPFSAATRPPKPGAPVRIPIDLQGWGIVLEWSEPSGWNNAASASVRLYRKDGTAAQTLIQATPGLSGRYVDTNYPFGVPKAYTLQIVTPSPLNGADNESPIGPATDAIGPIGVVSLGAPSVLEIGQKASELITKRLLGVR